MYTTQFSKNLPPKDRLTAPKTAPHERKSTSFSRNSWMKKKRAIHQRVDSILSSISFALF
jgi:hypothetical protein